MNKKLITSAMLLATSAAYGMDLDDTAQKHIAILKKCFCALKPIAKENSKGAIHAYHSPQEKMTHIFIVDRYGNSLSFRRYQMRKDQSDLVLYNDTKEMTPKNYDQAFQSFELMSENEFVTKLPLGDY